MIYLCGDKTCGVIDGLKADFSIVICFVSFRSCMRNFVEATTPPNPMSNMSTGQIHFQL